ncbi:DUF4832 domain-containing protein [Oxalobacteraceae bacterium OTU3CINTB1]|nr:DUF4832 domain-containing protein [Oxalobacteraceae bacterium OTU3CINTB1]
MTPAHNFFSKKLSSATTLLPTDTSRLMPLASLALVFFFQSPQALAQQTTINLAESSEAFKNPMKGFRPTRYIQDSTFPSHEYATVYKQYIKYTDLENNATDSVQKIKDWSNVAWAGIENKNIKVIPRVIIVYPNGPGGGQYWPAGIAHDGTPSQWTTVQLRNRLVSFVSKLGQAWDGDPRVAAVELGLWGNWGEHHIYPATLPNGEDRIPVDFQTALGTAYAQAFPSKKVMVRYPDSFSGFQVGYIWDSFALPDEAAAGEALIARKTWPTQMNSGEVAYDWGDQSRLGGSPDGTLSSASNTDYVIDWIRRTNTSSLGWIAEYSAGNTTIAANATKMQKALGYRYVLGSATFPLQSQSGSNFPVSFTITNKGNAPFYYRWPVKASLLRADKSVAWSGSFSTDIRTWMPGKSYTVSQAFALPSSLGNGVYTLALSINDPAGDLPSLRFANKNYYSGGWTVVGKVGVGQTPTNQNLGTFDVLKTDSSLKYNLVSAPTASTVFARSANQALVSGGAALANCAACVSGQKVGYIGNNRGELKFTNIPVKVGGVYALTVSYLSDTARSVSVSINDQKVVNVPVEASGGWEKRGTKTIDIPLAAGNNTLRLFNSTGWAPDIDKVEIAGPFSVQ